MHVTRDGGKNWTNVTPKDMPDFGRVSQIDASTFEPGGAYVAVKRPLLDDLAPYIFRTRDFGTTWTKIVGGIPAKDYVHVVREDPTRRGLLYAGTQSTVFVSFNDGDKWEPLALNLPGTPVSDLIVEDNSIAISTHGRGFYILDDISALRATGLDTTNADVVLFRPADAVRGGGGATITYLLRKPAEKLTIEVLDAKGQVAQTIQGAPPAGRGGRGRGEAAADGPGRRGRRWWSRPRRPADGIARPWPQPHHLEPRLPRRDDIPGHGALGRDDERSGRDAWELSGTAHRWTDAARRSRSS